MSEEENNIDRPPFYNKISKISSSYQNRESALRIGMLNKIVANLEANPCTDGTAQCGDNTICVVDGDDGYVVSLERCICFKFLRKTFFFLFQILVQLQKWIHSNTVCILRWNTKLC